MMKSMMKVVCEFHFKTNSPFPLWDPPKHRGRGAKV